MKTLKRANLPESIEGYEYSSKLTVECINNFGGVNKSVLPKDCIIVEVLPSKLKGILDLHNKPYKPSIHIFIKIQKRELEYVGVDFWSRPVFQDDRGNYFGNMDILFDGDATYEQVREKISEENIYYFGRDMDDDPMGTKIDPNKIVLVEQLTKEEVCND